MTGSKTTSQAKANSKRPFGKKKKPQHPVPGLIFFIAVLAALAIAGAINYRPAVTLFVAGEIATHNVAADQDLLVEDSPSTRRKQHKVADLQPPVFDLSYEAAEELQLRSDELFGLLNVPVENGEQEEKIRWQVSESLNTEISGRTYSIWKKDSFQKLVQNKILPWVVARLNTGITDNVKRLSRYPQGILVRNLSDDSETLKLDLQSFSDIPQTLQDVATLLKKKYKKPLRTRKAVSEFLTPLITPSLTLNRETTSARKKTAVESVDPVYYHIKKGEIIVRQGEAVTTQDQLKLQALLTLKNQTFFPRRMAGIFIVSLLLGCGLAFARPGKRLSQIKNKDLVFTGLLLLLFAGGAKGIMLLENPLQAASSQFELLPLLYPVSGAMGLVAMVFGLRRCSVLALMVSFLCTVLSGGELALFLYYFIGGMCSVLLMKRTQNRSDIALSVFPLIAGLTVAWLAIALYKELEVGTIWNGFLLVVGNGLLSLIVVFGVSPIVELAFHYTTRFRLMELMNLEQPILQELMVSAPGTYHHSLVVANMVEAGAKSINAHSLLCKVAALYHDMGKLHKPEYFIENQSQMGNPHDKLSPSMSTLVITNHVKKGVELAQKHRLGQEIEDIIAQHHGTSLVRFFFQKAQENGENPREADYQYTGPKPQTKEAAIVMLADAVEASSRVLADPTPNRLNGHIDYIIKSIFAEGQLDEAELTFTDLNKLGESFHRILTGIFHRRIEYPDPEKKMTDKNSPKEPSENTIKNSNAS